MTGPSFTQNLDERITSPENRDLMTSKRKSVSSSKDNVIENYNSELKMKASEVKKEEVKGSKPAQEKLVKNLSM